MLKVYGTLTSPYVRRVRLLLDSQRCPYELINLDYYGKDREFVRKMNPLMKIPFIEDVESSTGKSTIIYDSRIIARYLHEKFQIKPLTWEEENKLTLIETTNDAILLLFQAKERSGMDIDQDITFFQVLKDRIATCLPVFEHQINAGEFAEWNYPSICLLSMIDWTQCRKVVDLAAYPVLTEYVRSCYEREETVRQTDPRLAPTTNLRKAIG